MKKIELLSKILAKKLYLLKSKSFIKNYCIFFNKNYQMYLDSENGAVATLLRNDDLHSENISVDENFRVVSFILKFMLNIFRKS